MSPITVSRSELNASARKLINAAQTTDILNQLPGNNLLQIDSATNFYKSWPIGKEWRRIKNIGVAALGTSLTRKERQTIEQKLENIEGKFNDYLQQTKKLPRSRQLSWLLKKIRKLQEQIYHPQGATHSTYPFFLPVFSLHLALIQTTAQSAEDYQESLNTLVFGGVSYLHSALQSAYRQRYEDIVIKRGGARNELGYVEDSRNNKSLTEWVNYAENKESLKALRKYLSAKLALKYVEGINFSVAGSVLDGLIKLLPNEEEEEASVYSIQKAASAQIAQWKQASETTTQVDDLNTRLLIPTAYDESLAPEEPEAMDYVKEYYKTLAIGAIGDLPIPGAAALSAVTGLFVGWIFGDENDQWEKYAEAIKDYIDEAITGLETNNIENDLITAEEEFDKLCKILDQNGWEFGQPLSDDPQTCDELQDRFITLISQLNELRQALYNPESKDYTTFPYFDRLFTLHGAVLGTATTTMKTYNTHDEFEEHFKKSRDYLLRAADSAVSYRRGAIDVETKGSSNVSRFYDDQSDSYFSDKRPLNGNDARWDAAYALKHLLQTELGYVYPNRLKILASIHNFDKMVDQYNEFWSERKSDHVPIERLFDEWHDKVRDAGFDYSDPGIRGTINDGYSSWDNGPAVYDGLYYDETLSPIDLCGPLIFNSGNPYVQMYLPITDYPRTQDVIPLGKFDTIDISPLYKMIVYSEENFEGNSYTFNHSSSSISLSNCGFEIQSIQVIYTKSR